MIRIVPALTATALLALTLGACADDDDATVTTPAPLATAPGTGTAPPTSVAAPGFGTGNTAPSTNDEQTFSGTLAAGGAGDAISYDADAAPVGAEIGLVVEARPGDTTFVLSVSGLQPDRGYAVHAHVNPCGPTGDVAGPHFQHTPDPAATPEQPSSDPAYANPDNEVWLDLTTDGDGAGEATATVPFTLEGGAPQSIVIHAGEMTMTAPGEAGKAGDRVACMTTPLG